MIEADTLTIALMANDAAQTIMQAGPPSDLPAQVPDFVSGILDAVRNWGGEGALGEMISGMTPGGSEAADGAETAVGAGAENMSA